ncbi:MAG TPA: hypothetical protein VLJ37_06600 [bacterium]|nr:hypothetical protein [bacterium]
MILSNFPLSRVFTQAFDPLPPPDGNALCVKDYRSELAGSGTPSERQSERRIAPGKVTLTSRIPGSGEVPSGNYLTEPASPAQTTAAHDDPFGLHLETGARQNSQAAAAPAVEDVRLAAPSEVDFGEIPVGEVNRHNVHVYNLHGTGSAYVDALLAGSHEIQLGHRSSNRLRPSREDPGIPIPLVYQPAKSGPLNAKLTVNATWEPYTGWAHKTVEIPIRGAAYVHGEDPPSVVAARRLKEEEEAKTKKADAARATEVLARIDADQEIARPYPQNALNKLDNAFLRAKNALEYFNERREIGIGVAAEEAEAFRKKLPNASSTLLFDLAMYALDMATYGLSGQAAQVAKLLLSRNEKTTAVGALVGDMIKGGIRSAGHSVRDALFQGPTRPGTEDADQPRIRFFALQQNALVNSRDERREALVRALIALRPLLRSEHPEEAADAMNAIAETLRTTSATAVQEQADASRFAWMRFLAQTDLGSLASGEVDLRSALNLPREHDPLPRYDGLLDLEITLDSFNPLESAKITRARMNGVTPATAESLSTTELGRLLQKGVILRVHFKDPRLAVLKAVVVFDGDDVVFEDDTAPAGRESDWLSRMGGYTGRPSPERQRLGAIALRERLLRTTVLGELGLQVKTDHLPRKWGEP